MTTEMYVKSAIEKMQGSGKTFAEFIAELFNNEFLEIYVGDTYEQISVEQISVEYPAVFCGKVVGAYKECLIISAAYIDDNKKMKLGNLMFINERAIRSLSPLENNSPLEDMFLRGKEAILVKKHFKS
jgi:hypothetical protein